MTFKRIICFIFGHKKVKIKTMGEELHVNRCSRCDTIIIEGL
jgi:hypothetical protein